MQARSSQQVTDYQLCEHQPLRLENTRQGIIECTSGKVWLTAYDQFHDVVLGTGATFTIPNDGLTLVEAVGYGSIRVHPRQAGQAAKA